MKMPTKDSSPVFTPIGSNELGSMFSFMARRYYAESVYPESQESVDLWNDKYFYGKIDEFGNAVYPSETNLRQITSPENPESLFAIDFVADAYADLQRTFKDAIMQRKISADSPYGVLKPKGAWYSATQGYEDWMGIMYDELFTKFFIKKVERDTITFQDFLKTAIDLFVRVGFELPITKTGFILSKYNSSRMSGLVLEVQNNPHDTDQKKSEYVKNREFDFFRRAATNHGFLVNKNAPWVLVADVNSSVMKEYQEPYGIVGSTDMFESYYYKSYSYDIDILKRILVTYWNSFAAAHPSPTQFCATRPRAEGRVFNMSTTGSKTRVKSAKREPVFAEDIERRYPFSFWLRQYFRIRLAEMGVSLDALSFEKKMREANQVRAAMDDKSALIFLNKYLTNIKQRDSLFVGAHSKDLIRRARNVETPTKKTLSGLGPTIY